MKTGPAFPILKTSAKSVQTTAEVCADYTCSLCRLQLKSPENTTYLQFYVRVLTKVFTCTYYNEYDVLISVSARTYKSHLAKTQNGLYLTK